MNTGKRGRTFSPRWTAWPKSTPRELGHESELESDRARTSGGLGPAAGTRDRDRRRTGAAPGSRLRRRARRRLIGSGSRGARPAELRLAVAGMRIEPRGTASGRASYTTVAGIDRTQRRNPNGIVHTRLAFRRANAGKKSRPHVDRRIVVGARHWAEHGHLQRRLRHAARAAAVSEPRPARACMVAGARKPGQHVVR